MFSSPETLKTTSTISTSASPATTIPTNPRSPGFPSIPHGNLTAKGIDITNTSHPLSSLRTSIPSLPFPHPKYHVRYSTGEIYEVVSPIVDEYDPVTGYIGSVGEVRQSIEVEEVRQGASEKWKTGEGLRGGERWNGYVVHPESRERSSIVREAKRGRDDGSGERHREGEARGKRMRERV